MDAGLPHLINHPFSQNMTVIYSHKMNESVTVHFLSHQFRNFLFQSRLRSKLA